MSETATEARLTVKDWRAIGKGAVLGSCTVELPLMRIREVLILSGKNGVWASLPSKPQIDTEGRVRVDDNGKRIYVPVVEHRSKEVADRFTAAVVAALRRNGVEL